jgi:NADH-quinone oxidoreductase subunit M
MLAVILYSGLAPAHLLVSRAFDNAPILLTALAMNSQLGAFLIARVAASLFPDLADDALSWLSGLALFTSLYTAFLGIAQRDPRRLLSTLMVSQSSAILAGIAGSSREGYTGALVQWIVVALASTALIAIYRSVEVRIGGHPGGHRFLGLAAQMPRLAVFFAISGLALIGLPGTLGFCGQHLLVHGMLANHSWWGVALPIAIALNAYHVFTLFTHLFLGKPVFHRSGVSDALPRERWALSAFVVLLILGGLAPNYVVSLREMATDSVSRGHGEPESRRGR